MSHGGISPETVLPILSCHCGRMRYTMRMNFNIVRTLLVFSIAFLPATSFAYFTTGQQAMRLSENAALFTIEYAFGLNDHDMYMPVLAVRNLSEENSRTKVGYSIREESETITTEGTTAGIVLSSAPIVDGMYKLEKGKAQKMTLLVLYITDPEAHEEDYALQVDWLPFSVDKGGAQRQQLQLNPSELQYYITKEVELNTGNFED